jgi:enamine deaminase RidA (YjgF/YER057c/UK114 family)
VEAAASATAAIAATRPARQLMAQVASDLGTRLEWVAIDHHDTAHPHVHIAVRGVDENGNALLLARDYVRGGIRARSQELLTRALGHRHEHEHRPARESAIEAPRLTEIDRTLLGRADESGTVAFDDSVPARPIAQERRLQELRRLQYLEGLGLAGAARWKLSLELVPALRQIQLAGDVQKSLARSRTLVSDRDAPVALTRMVPGVEVTGRVTGGGIDEARDEPLLILEGTDGRRHLIPQTPEIVAARGEGRLRPGSVVTLRGGLSSHPGAREPRTDVVEHGSLRPLKRTETASTVLDLGALRSVRSTGALPAPVESRRGFFRRWQAAVRSRGPLLGLRSSRESRAITRKGFSSRAQGCRGIDVSLRSPRPPLGVNDSRLRRSRCGSIRPRPAPASAGPAPEGHDLCLGVYAVRAHGVRAARSAMRAPTINVAKTYGADFSRGIRIVETNKIALHVSRTASVDEAGRTAHPGDLEARTDRMLRNVAALLEGQGATFRDMVSATTYLRRPADAPRLRAKLRQAGFMGFPNALVAAPICGPELLCETEALAVLPRPAPARAGGGTGTNLH